MEIEAGSHIGYYKEQHVQTWLTMDAVSPQEAALLFFGVNPFKYKYQLPYMGDDFDTMKRTFEDAARDGLARNLRDWVSVARNRNLQGVCIDGWEACIAVAAPVEAAGASNGTTEQAQDPERRLALLRALGGSADYARGTWRFKGMAALVTREKSDGYRRCDEKTIRADLNKAAQAEREAKSAGPFNGLGQR
jgi:hypothetical protein